MNRELSTVRTQAIALPVTPLVKLFRSVVCATYLGRLSVTEFPAVGAVMRISKFYESYCITQRKTVCELSAVS